MSCIKIVTDTNWRIHFMKKIISIFLVFTFIIPFTCSCSNKNISSGFLKECVLNKNTSVKIKSGNLSVDYTINRALQDIKTFGLNTINIPVIINIDSLTSSNMSIDNNSEKKAITLIKKLKKTNISIILEPYPWINNGTLYETDWKPDNTNAFFTNWKVNVLKKLIKDIANPYNIDAINTASNLVNLEYDEKDWCSTIDYVKSLYKGLITYRTNWWSTAEWDTGTKQSYQNKLNNKLFSKVDFISVAAYFELTNNRTNTVKNLVSAIKSTQIYDRKQNIPVELENFYKKWKKPIFFGELGFPKRDGASIQPYNPDVTETKNDEEQANCFEAYREVFENKPWFIGFSIFAIGENSSDKHYYPSQETTAVIKKWSK